MKAKDLKGLSKEEKERRIKELKLELVKSKVEASKTGSSKIKNIKRTIAQILTLNK
jgi:ribosomal protein L29